jgi:hypothetical protein
MDRIPICSVCDSGQHLSEYWGGGGLNDVCRGCFFIWYDGDIPRDGGVRGEDMRNASLLAKVNGIWPFDGHMLPKADEAERERARAALSQAHTEVLLDEGDR